MAKNPTPKSSSSKPELTTRQVTILDFIKTSTESQGYAPSMREIGEAAGLNSPASVKYQLDILEEKGFIRRSWNRSRSVELLPSRSGGRAIELPMRVVGRRLPRGGSRLSAGVLARRAGTGSCAASSRFPCRTSTVRSSSCAPTCSSAWATVMSASSASTGRSRRRCLASRSIDIRTDDAAARTGALGLQQPHVLVKAHGARGEVEFLGQVADGVGGGVGGHRVQGVRGAVRE